MEIKNIRKNNFIFDKITKLSMRIILLSCFIVLVLSIKSYAASQKYGEFYEIQDGYITRILPETTYKDLKNNLENDNIKVTRDGQEISDDEYIGTGMTLSVLSDTYLVSVVGDLDGNGIISITDLSRLRLYVAGLMNLEDKYKKSADTSNDGEITITDLTQLNLAVVKIKDFVAPESFTPSITTSKNTITIIGNTVDTNTGVAEYSFKLDSNSYVKNTNDLTDGKYQFTNVDLNQTHTVLMKVKDKAGNEKKTQKIIIGKHTSAIEIIPSTTEWTNEDILVGIEYNSNISNAKRMVSIDGGSTFKEYKGPVKIENNTEIIAQIRNKNNEIVDENNYNVKNIDKEFPVITTPTAIAGVKSIKVNISATDSGSGIKEYEFILKKGNWEWSVKSTENQYTFNNLKPLEKYIIEVYVFDRAGNGFSVSDNKEILVLDGYTLTIDTNGGTYQGSTSIKGEPGETKVLEVPTKDGYEFEKWEIVTGPGSLSSNSFTFGEGNTTIKAKWIKVNEYTLTIDANGGIYQGSTSVKGKAGSTVSIGQPTQNGYELEKWEIVTGPGSLNSNSFTFGEGNTTIRAKWIKVNYVLTLNANYGKFDDGNEIMTISQKVGTELNIPTPKRTHTVKFNTMGGNKIEDKTPYCKFSGWYENKNGGNKITYTTMPNKDDTIYALWGEASVNLPKPTWEGHTFLGWYTNSNYEGNAYKENISYTVTGDTTLYAKWETGTYTITYDAAGGTLLTPSSTATYGVEINLPKNVEYKITFKSNGGTLVGNTDISYKFEGWYDEQGQKIETTKINMPGKNTTLTARWSIDGLTMPTATKSENTTITIDTNGGTLPDGAETSFASANTFVGWYIDEDCNTPLNSNTVINASCSKLYAKYQSDIEVSTLPTVTKDGSTFEGWLSSSDNAIYNVGDRYTLPTDTTFTAQWSDGTQTASTLNNIRSYFSTLKTIFR